MSKTYIQRKGNGYLETVDELDRKDFSSIKAFRRELARLLAEYSICDPSGRYYPSGRQCANWR